MAALKWLAIPVGLLLILGGGPRFVRDKRQRARGDLTVKPLAVCLGPSRRFPVVAAGRGKREPPADCRSRKGRGAALIFGNLRHLGAWNTGGDRADGGVRQYHRLLSASIGSARSVVSGDLVVAAGCISAPPQGNKLVSKCRTRYRAHRYQLSGLARRPIHGWRLAGGLIEVEIAKTVSWSDPFHRRRLRLSHTPRLER